MKKRVLSFLLAAVMLVGAVFTTAISAEETLYPDVAADRWSAADIAYVTEKGMMQDTGDGEFEPAKAVNRAMVVTVLYRLAGEPEVSSISKFFDVKSTDAWYHDAVVWGSSNEIVQGFSDNTFRPLAPVTREQLVTFIGRYAEMNHIIVNGEELDGFSDSDSIQSYALEYFKWAVAVALVKGVTDDEIRPAAGATREQFAAIMHRFDTSDAIEYELLYNEPTAYSQYTEKEYPLRDDADFFVSTAGDDSNDGKTKATAFKTFERAKEAVREFKKTATDEIVVAFMAGDYGFLDNITFTAEDAGTEEVPITYCKYGDGEVTFNNGLKIDASDFVSVSEEESAIFQDKEVDSIKKIDLSDIAVAEELIGGALFNDDGLCTVARYPNKKMGEKDVFSGGTCFKVDNYTIQVLPFINNRLKEYHTFDDVIFAGKFVWEYQVERCTVTNYDRETGNVTLAGAAYHIVADDEYGGNKPFIIENAAYELDNAGEYWIDKDTCTLYVYDPQGTYEFAYTQKGFITVTDGAANITFRGFDFSCASAREVTGDFIFPQYTTWKEVSATAALNCTTNTENITVDLCSFSRIGSAYAVFLDGHNMSFTNNEVFLCAGGGIFTYCEDTLYRDELLDNKKLIYNNLIHSVGLKYTTYHHAIYSWDSGALISHNEIHDSAHFALEHAGVNTIFEYNAVYRCNTHVQDAGVIYSAQFFTRVGNVIRYNLLYESDAGFGIYIDNGLSGQEIYGNLFYNTSGSDTILISGGRENDVIENIIINTTDKTHLSICANAKYYGMAVDAVERGLDRLDSSTWGGVDNGPYTIWPEPGSKSEQIWKEAYPWLYELIFDFKQYENPNCAVNQANCTITDNISFVDIADYEADEHDIYNIHETTVALGNVKNNYSFDLSENPIFVDPTRGDYRIREDADLSEISKLPYVPFEEMGRE